MINGYWHQFGQRYPFTRLVIVMIPLVVLLIWGNNQRQDAERRHTNKQFAKSILLTDHKFRQALAISTRQFAYAHNAQVCAFRAATLPELKSYKDAAKDETLSASARERNAKRIRDSEEFLSRLVTIPTGFNCADLPRRPPA